MRTVILSEPANLQEKRVLRTDLGMGRLSPSQKASLHLWKQVLLWQERRGILFSQFWMMLLSLYLGHTSNVPSAERLKTSISGTCKLCRMHLTRLKGFHHSPHPSRTICTLDTLVVFGLARFMIHLAKASKTRNNPQLPSPQSGSVGDLQKAAHFMHRLRLLAGPRAWLAATAHLI